MKQHSILIVEDEAIIALDLRLQLEDLGYRVVGTAGHGAQALEMARSGAPDLVLMDIRLRGAMDGIEAAGLISRELATPVIYLTSHSDPDTVQRASRTAPYGYLTKPFQIKELRAGIEVALYKGGMERQLREADRWFASTLQCVQDGVLVTELDARIRFMNPAAEALTGWPLEQALGQHVDEVVCFRPSGAEPVATAVTRALQQGRVIGVQHGRRLATRGVSQEVPVDESAGPIDDPNGRRMGAVLVLRNAAERLRAEAHLRASEQRFRSAFDFAPLGMALIGLDGRFIQVNDALCRLLGRDAIWLREQRQSDLTLPEDREHEERRLHQLLASGAGVTQFEKRYLHREPARLVPALVSVSLLQELDAPTCFLYQVHDLTEQKKAAEQLAELAAERLRREASETASRSKSEFLSRVSHEMRTPLNAVLGFGQLLQMGAGEPGDAKTQAYAEHIVTAGQHLLTMVNGLLNSQRPEGGQLRLQIGPVRLHQVVAESAELLAPAAQAQKIDFEIRVPDGLTVRADPTRLRQVLLNLGSNAVKYNRPGGKVAWIGEPADDAQPPGRVRLRIEDNGIGMTAEQMQRLFQPFERLGQENSAIPGTGLGLVITRHLIEQMGGSMGVTSEPRGGTCIALEFEAG
jgi:PAS domain S-box-containing protein